MDENIKNDINGYFRKKYKNKKLKMFKLIKKNIFKNVKKLIIYIILHFVAYLVGFIHFILSNYLK